MKTTAIFFDFVKCVRAARLACEANNYDKASEACIAAIMISSVMQCHDIDTTMKTILDMLNESAPLFALPHLQNFDNTLTDLAKLLSKEAKPCSN